MNAPKTKLTNRQKAYLHGLARDAGLSDANYRDLLELAAGVRSSSELDQAGFERVLDMAEDLGLMEPRSPKRKGLPTAPDFGERRGMATSAQLTYLYALAEEYFDHWPEGLHAWLRRYLQVEHPRFLTKGTASRAIEALKAMSERSREAS